MRATSGSACFQKGHNRHYVLFLIKIQTYSYTYIVRAEIPLADRLFCNYLRNALWAVVPTIYLQDLCVTRPSKPPFGLTIA